ncbi:MAG: DNA-processing protein DprA [Peptococcaceae bacterium]
MRELVYWVILQKIWGIKGNNTLLNLIKNISGRDFWALTPQEMKRYFPIISQEMANKFYAGKNELNLTEEYNIINKHNVKIVSYCCRDYPQRLKLISSPPPLLYVKGTLTDKGLSIAVVGARKASPYGRKAALHIATQLSLNGIQVISGLARGVDTAGHEGGLKGSGGTIAVLGNSLDIIYPKDNSGLYKKILTDGNSAVISEYPVSTPPLKFNFPVRNRIISGLADGVVVIEAGEKSGSLITAEFALEQGKDVFVVPGPIDNLQYKGSHKLIKDGAKLVDDVQDIVEEFGQLQIFKEVKKSSEPDLSENEGVIFKLLSSNPVSLEELQQSCSLSIKEILTILSILEIKGLVKQTSGRKFISLYWGDYS